MQYLHFSNDPKCILYLCLGEKDNRVYGLRSDNVLPQEIEIFKAKFDKTLTEKSEILAWLKTNMPNAYKNAYREYPTNSFVVLTTHVFNT